MVVMVVTELTDAELLDRARDGDESAFTSLYVRHHGAIARLAASYRQHEPEDLVDATFGQVVSQLRRRSGPTEAFRAYLFAVLHAEAVAAPSLARAPVEAVPEPVALVAGLPALGGADREMITRAFESLPDQWQVPLWHTTIVGTDLPTLAAGLSVTVAAARPLARYAGRKLRQAYLQAHLDAAPRPACEPHRERLTAHLQGALDADADAGVRAHLERCDSCRELIAGLSGVEELLARSVVPFFPVAAGRGGVPTPLGAPGSAATEATGEGPVLDVSDVPPGGDDEPSDETSAGFVGWWRRRRKPPFADEADPFAPVLGAVAARREPDLPQEDAGVGPAGADSEGDTGEVGDQVRGRRVVPALGGAAAVTVLVAALAVVGARVMGDDSGPGLDGVSADEADGLDSAGGGLSVDTPSSDSRDGRKGTSDRTTTTAAGDDRRPSEDDDRERIEPVPRRGDSLVASGSVSGSGSGSGATTETTTRRPSTTTTRPTTTTTAEPEPPPPLAAWSVGWSAGTLRITVQSPSGTADTHSVVVTVNLSSGAHVASLDGGCSGSGPVTCTVAAPDPGSATIVSIGLTVDGAGESATVSARQGSSSLGSRSVSLVAEPAA